MKKLLIMAWLAAAILCSCGSKSSSLPYATLPPTKAADTTKSESESKTASASENKAIIGKWVAKSVNGSEEDAKSMLPGEKCYILINADGSAVIRNNDTQSSATYTFDGETLTVTAMNDSRRYAYSNGLLTLKYKGGSGKQNVIIYKKTEYTVY